ncbi:MAG: nitroreductase family protein [Candidatus Aenigmarchaeota archaeon]|nr:nitroreductase family protein [Candidatus Aenigmarchaeota archaeon]
MPFDSLARFGRGGKIVEEQEKVEPIIDEEEIVAKTIRNRMSVRKYLDKDVSQDLVSRVLEASRHTPSAGNYQPWEFIVVRDVNLKNDIVEACYNQNWMKNAPVFIVACMNCRLAGAVYGERGLRLYGIQAVAAAIQNMLLSAQSMGLGTCWVGAFSEIVISKIMQCPEYVRPCAIITLGYPDLGCTPHAKKHNKNEYIHYEKFGQTGQLKSVIEEKSPTFIKLE